MIQTVCEEIERESEEHLALNGGISSTGVFKG